MSLSAGLPPALPPRIKQYLLDDVMIAAQLGWPLHRQQIKMVVTVYCQRLDLKPFQGNNKPGHDSMTKCTQRYKDQLSLRQIENLTEARAHGLTRLVGDNFYEQFGKNARGAWD